MSARPYKAINFRVVIDVVGHPWLATQDRNEVLINDHAKDLLKVVKPVAESLGDSYRNARVDFDIVCKFCDHPWLNAKDENGNPVCCQDAIDEYERAKSLRQ